MEAAAVAVTAAEARVEVAKAGARVVAETVGVAKVEVAMAVAMEVAETGVAETDAGNICCPLGNTRHQCTSHT